MKNKRFTLFTLVMVMSVMCFVGMMLVFFLSKFALLGIMSNYSTGNLVGYVTQFSQEGTVFKTYEGRLQVSQGSQVAIQRPFNFSVRKDNQEMLEKISAAMQKGNKVLLKYQQWVLMPANIGNSGYEAIDLILIPL